MAMLIILKCLLTSKSSAVSAPKPPVKTASLLKFAIAFDSGQAHLGTSHHIMCQDVFAAAMPQLSEQAEHPCRLLNAEMRHLNVYVNISIIPHDFSHILMLSKLCRLG